eukprot:GHVP01060707.1.p1 GENE.GHVP01060707.1~~GHVP01060707.1.p1  ORF type:complete len:825 (+),score=156.37 GHVP01060707.1:1280-3754(+)
MAAVSAPREIGGAPDDKPLDVKEQWHQTYSKIFRSFLLTYEEANELKYKKFIEQVSETSKNLTIDFQDLMKFPEGDDLSDFIQRFYQKLISFITEFVYVLAGEILGRRIPVEVSFMNAPLVHSIRSLRCELLGTFTSVRGTVTRTSDVRPELLEGNFVCDNCGAQVNKVAQQYKYTEPSICPISGCGNRSKWRIVPEGCKFGDWQKLRLQENASEIPAGSMPRTMDVIVRDSCCDNCKPGDQIVVAGCLLAVPDVPSLLKPGNLPKSVSKEGASQFGAQDSAIHGLRKLGVRDLSYRLVFLGCHVTVSNIGTKTFGVKGDEDSSDIFDGLTNEQRALFEHIANSDSTLSTLIRDIAPAILGHEDVKKGILLMLTGGVGKRTSQDAIKLRGDINVCIVGDPGVAKSQLLKFVQSFAPRAVYASGKSSTAAGLTASVHKDHDQGDAVIEAGALMLADKGVCCIDEFEKMDDKDMVAIHEAMEQQTISISKAGIHATLNARASVLAACNPYNGRYDTTKSFKQNVRLSAPVLSRFDLLFVMVDDTELDESVARHIVQWHARGVGVSSEHHGAATLREYIRIAKKFKPRLLKESKDLLVRAYSNLRHTDTLPGNQRSVRVTVRQLESLIRLSEAIAKLHFSDEVTPSHVSEAYKLFSNSLSHIKKGSIQLDDEDDDVVAANEDGNHFRMEAAEFELMSTVIINYLRKLEESTSGAGVCVPKEELVTMYLENHVECETEDELKEEARKLSLVLTRMIQRDLTLIEEDVEETPGNIIQTVRIHPNFVTDDARGATNTKHANLSTEYYDEENSEVPNLSDQEFLDLIYGES